MKSKELERFYSQISNNIESNYKVNKKGSSIKLNDGNNKPIKIYASDKLLILELDKKKPQNIFPFFNKQIKNLCKVADFILIYPKENIIYVFIVELKSKNSTGAIEQVRASYELGKYICNTTNRMLNYPDIAIKYRGLIFTSKTLTKGSSKPKNLNYEIDDSSKIKFKHLYSNYEHNLDNLCR